MDIRPILPADLPAACTFMQATLTPSIPLERWKAAFSQPWSEDPPNHGFLMIEDRRIVGTLGCAYSARQIGAHTIRFCNFSSWSVQPEQHGKGLLLLSAAMKQSGYIFTNFTPNHRTLPIFGRLRFRRVDTTRWIMLNLPGRVQNIVLPGDTLMSALPKSEATIYRFHRDLMGVHHIGLRGRGGVNLISFIRTRFRRIPCALVIHAGDWHAFAENLRAFRKAALMRFGFPLTAVETRRLIGKPEGALTRLPWMPALYRGDGVADDDIDGLYSEIVTLTPLAR